MAKPLPVLLLICCTAPLWAQDVGTIKVKKRAELLSLQADTAPVFNAAPPAVRPVGLLYLNCGTMSAVTRSGLWRYAIVPELQAGNHAALLGLALANIDPAFYRGGGVTLSNGMTFRNGFRVTAITLWGAIPVSYPLSLHVGLRGISYWNDEQTFYAIRPQAGLSYNRFELSYAYEFYKKTTTELRLKPHNVTLSYYISGRSW